MTKSTLKPLLKWIGNKRKSADEIISYMPQRFGNYIEPFLGSGAVLATLLNKNKNPMLDTPVFTNVIAGDILTPLIGIFDYVKNDPQVLINHYKKYIEKFYNDRENTYLEIRNNFNCHRDPLDFAVLTRTCYSGIIRFRKSDGYMSTPIGPHKPIAPHEFEERVFKWSSLIKNVTFINADFKQTMRLAKEGDLIYCDPPYTHSQTILYGAQAFNIEELWNEIYYCKQKGVKVMLSINGKKQSKSKDIGENIPKDLFERGTYIDCGISMINRLQKAGEVMENEDVHDKLLFTW